MDSISSFRLCGEVQVGSDVYVFKLGCNCDGSALAAATSENSLCVLDPATLKVVRRLEGHTDAVEDLEFFQAAPSCLVSCSHDGSARVWDLRASEEAASVRSFPAASQEVYSCSVGRGDTALACAASEKIHLFDVGQGKRLKVYKDMHCDVVNHVRFHPVDTTKLISGAEDNLVALIDTNVNSPSEAMLACIPNDECVRNFTLVGPNRDTLCCHSTTEDVRIWGLGQDDCGVKKAEFPGLRDHPLLTREESGGYVVQSFYDQPTQQVFLLAGAGNLGDLVLFRLTQSEPMPVALFDRSQKASDRGSIGVSLDGDGCLLTGHTDIVRSAISMPGGILITAGEDGRVCGWRQGAGGVVSAAEDPVAAQAQTGDVFDIEPTSYGAARSSGRPDRRAAPY
eukprot:TRINITY_DN91365_c0_g1_i1.p1 TRINITY_DN91365_c0_g1~~TRINITY_DN91365_c0_g1_i1.p1  ORF type:complete len:396 (-),score=37.46 TRINITY_DN91365_c0_g1_i1:51-1238(-)